MDLLSKILPHDKEVVVRTLSLMLINIKNELWISFLMAHPLMVQVIGVSVDEQNEELVEHYISFLKSLAIRLDINNLSLFYNKVPQGLRRNSQCSPWSTRASASTTTPTTWSGPVL